MFEWKPSLSSLGATGTRGVCVCAAGNGGGVAYGVALRVHVDGELLGSVGGKTVDTWDLECGLPCVLVKPGQQQLRTQCVRIPPLYTPVDLPRPPRKLC